MGRHLRDVTDPSERIVLDVGDRPVEINFVEPASTLDLRAALIDHSRPAPLSKLDPEAVIRVGRKSPQTRMAGDPIEFLGDIELRQNRAGAWQAWTPRSVSEWDDDAGETMLSPEAPAFEAPISIALMLLGIARKPDTMPMHAGLIAHGEGAAMVLGASGQGKSSTIGAAMRAGFRIGSDDAVFVRETDSGHLVRGFPRTPMVPAEVLPPDWVADRPRDHRERVWFHDEILATDWLLVQRLILVSHGDAPQSVLRDVPKPDVVRALIASVSMSFVGDTNTARLLATLGRLADLPTTALRLGSNPTRRGQSTAEILSRLVDFGPA